MQPTFLFGSNSTFTMQSSGASKWQMESQTITQGGAVAFLVIASGSLLVLYFFLDTAFYVILVSCLLGTIRMLLSSHPSE